MFGKLSLPNPILSASWLRWPWFNFFFFFKIVELFCTHYRHRLCLTRRQWLFCRWEFCLLRNCFWLSNCRACPSLTQRVLSICVFIHILPHRLETLGRLRSLRFPGGRVLRAFMPHLCPWPFPSLPSLQPLFSKWTPSLSFPLYSKVKSSVKPLPTLLLPFLSPWSHSFILCALQMLYTRAYWKQQQQQQNPLSFKPWNTSVYIS